MSDNTDQSTAPDGPEAAYLALLKAGELTADSQQQQIVLRLQALHEDLATGTAETSNGGFLTRLFGNGKQAAAPRGLYIHGGVGRGKSMLMDLFFETAPVAQKRRVHFHAFMLECHGIIHKWRGRSAIERREDDDGDPIPPLARKIAKGARLLCFDEFQVNDVADAMILGRLFEEFLGLGVTIVATSNRAPDALYEDGLNRELFLPFIELLKELLDVMALDGPTDYRLRRMKGVQVYHVPVDDRTTQQMRTAFFAMTDRDVEDADKVPSAELDVQGRTLFVPKSSKGVAVFSFKRLCANFQKPLGAADYLAIAWRYHTVFVVAIPEMGRDMRNEAKRFATLIDTLYENNVKLICSAAVEPGQLYPAGDGSFEFSRTASRLEEMQSEEYLARGHAV